MRRFSILPVACYAVIFVFACYGALVVGHWPHYARPDPKDLPYRALSYTAVVAMLVGVLSVFVLPVAYAAWRVVLRVRHRPIPSHRVALSIYAVGAVLWLLDFAAIRMATPWPSIMNWLLD